MKCFYVRMFLVCVCVHALPLLKTLLDPQEAAYLQSGDAIDELHPPHWLAHFFNIPRFHGSKSWVSETKIRLTNVPPQFAYSRVPGFQTFSVQRFEGSRLAYLQGSNLQGSRGLKVREFEGYKVPNLRSSKVAGVQGSINPRLRSQGPKLSLVSGLQFVVPFLVSSSAAQRRTSPYPEVETQYLNLTLSPALLRHVLRTRRVLDRKGLKNQRRYATWLLAGISAIYPGKK